MMNLTKGEAFPLTWLSEAEFSQYGECFGDNLDSLVNKGLAVILGPETEIKNSFLAKGRGMMFRAVQLTDYGKKTVEDRCFLII